jgi:hypothetical protein
MLQHLLTSYGYFPVKNTEERLVVVSTFSDSCVSAKKGLRTNSKEAPHRPSLMHVQQSETCYATDILLAYAAKAGNLFALLY